MTTGALGQETKYQPPVCVVPEIFALNGSTQQASGGRTTNPEALPVLRQKVGGQLDGPRYVRAVRL